MKNKTRAPVIAIVGHVDHGKTSLLDYIRGTSVAKTEPGQITQSIGATRIPADVVKKICGNLLEKMKIDLTIPGLLFIDTPGHESFTTLRKRGGAIADIAVLIIDVNEGFKPQTEESLNYLKQFKTPFVVAATKIDRLVGWNPQKDKPFFVTYQEQTQRTQDELEKKLYELIGQLGARGFESERVDRISDFAKQIVVVPVSGITGEGLPDLLMILSGLAQKYMSKKLELKPGEGKGTVLEVKEFRGLGTTIDIILYDGEIRKGDTIVIGGKNVVKTKVKALLEPEPMKELKTSNFIQIDSVTAAAGIKISASEIENVIPGSPLRAVRSEKDVEKAVKEVISEVDEVEIDTDKQGVILKAETLGGLEALIKSLQDRNIPIRKASVGNLTQKEIMESRVMEDPIIIVFGLVVPSDIMTMAKDNKVTVFNSKIIYSLLDDYEKWKQDGKQRREERILESITHPGRVRILPGYVFRASKPAVFGVEVLKGRIKTKYRLKKGGKIIGEIKEIQMDGDNVEEGVMGNKIALSIPGATVGKDVNENDVLDVFLTDNDMSKLREFEMKLKRDEKELLDEME
ncbi:MAG: translation initiation factor IF-2 [Nanoarchaeota archaeon]|nr:translation initiation factor IF-2 [Nanoarchaeota archaeon]